MISVKAWEKEPTVGLFSNGIKRYIRRGEGIEAHFVSCYEPQTFQHLP
jgi:hypothetical protein